MSVQWMIAGLGNPGSKYALTRHNIGFMVVDRLATMLDASFQSGRWQAESCECRFEQQKLVLIKPQTFMNLSGQSIQPALAHYHLDASRLIVVHDEIDLPFGEIRLKSEGGHRGHNGLRDIKARLGSGDFYRIRFGVGRPASEHVSVADYVLARFLAEELSELSTGIDLAIDQIRQLSQSHS
ncbi:MAG: aminoacyl-tRNA hydrolase [Leptospiraceae bacterium]|nr:aminoacyl-tRNA hydrolase [Leptospiraceae bacterium]